MKYIALALVLVLTGCRTNIPVNVSLLPAKPEPKVEFGGLPNFDVVDEEQGIYRSGQPDSQGFKYAKSIGVKRVLKLDEDTEGSDAEAIMLGLDVVKIPISTKEQLIGPVPVEQMKAFWKTNDQPTLVHCAHGQDRTGLAVYLYSRQSGWTQTEATEDMLSHGFHKLLFALWDAAKDN